MSGIGAVVIPRQSSFSSSTLTFNSDGTVTPSGNWFYPTTTGIGSGYYLRTQKDSGPAFFSVTGPVSLASGVTVSAVSGVGAVSGRFFISTDSGGVNVVFSGFLSVSNAG